MNQFTGKERDAETGLDFFQARYYSGAQGRWACDIKVGRNGCFFFFSS
jgi:RHS repeat-associated protein